jgi:conserved hypothetical protein (putative transposase or invertase)
MQQIFKQEKVLTTNDVVFKKVFASPQNSHILMGFINDILELNVTEVSVENTYNIKTFYDEDKHPHIRYTQVDVLARLGDGRQVTIEMQVCAQKLFKERALFYVTEIYSANYGKHELEDNSGRYTTNERKYSALRPVYSVCIMLENEFTEDDSPIHQFKLYDNENKLYYQNVAKEELLTLVFLEIKKSSSAMKENIKAWFDYFRTGEVAKDMPKYLQDACKVAKYQNLEEVEKDMISARQKAIDGALAREDYVWDQGKAEGKVEGKAEGKAEALVGIIQKLSDKGKSIKEIASLIDVDETEIKSIVE